MPSLLGLQRSGLREQQQHPGALVHSQGLLLLKLACPERFELPTLCLEGTCSFQLSYGQINY